MTVRTTAVKAAILLASGFLPIVGFARAGTGPIPGPASPDSLDVVRSLEERAKPEEAEALCRRLLERAESATPPDSLRATKLMTVLSSVLIRNSGKVAEARQLAERSLAIREKALGPEHPDVAESLYYLGFALTSTGDHAQARAVAERSLAIREKALGPNSLEAASSLYLLSQATSKSEDYASAKRYAERAVAIQEGILGPNDPTVARSLTLLARAMMDLGESDDKPIAMMRRVAQIYADARGPNHPFVASAEIDLSNYLSHAGDHAAARKAIEHALAIYETAYGPESPKLVVPLVSLARQLHFTFSDFVLAGAAYERAASISEKSLGPEHSMTAMAHVNLGDFLADLGDYERARFHSERALATYEKVLGPQSLFTAWSLTSLGMLDKQTGDYASARPLLERGLKIREDAMGSDYEDVSYSLIHLANLLRDSGDFAAARPLYERAWRIRERSFGPKHVDTAEPISGLARLNLWTGDLTSAKKLFGKALEICEQVQGRDRYQSTAQLAGLAEIARRENDLETARTLYGRALASVEVSVGADHPDVAWIQRCLGEVAQDQGKPAKALEHFDRAVALYETSLGPAHPDLAWALKGKAAALRALGRGDEALDAALRAEAIGREHLKLTMRTLSERQALDYAAARATGLSLALAIAAGARASSSEAVQRSWDALVRSRALVLDEMAARRRRGGAGGEEDSLTLACASAKRRLANFVVRGIGTQTPEAYRKLLEDARRESEGAERALAERNVALRRDREMDVAGLDQVLAALPKGGALLSFVAYDDESPRRGTEASALRYAALVSEGSGSAPRAIPLGRAGEIDSLVSEWRRAVTQEITAGRIPSEARYRSVATELRKIIWDPLAPHLEKARSVFVVPDGALGLVNFAALPVGTDQYLIERDPLIHYVGAERDLLAMRGSVPSRPGLLAMGDPDLDAVGTTDEPTLAIALGPQGNAASILSTFRGSTTGCPDFTELRWPRLPGAGREVADVVTLWSRSNPAANGVRGASSGNRGPEGSTPLALTGREASEGAFKRLAGRYGVVHLATHGFYVSDECGAQVAGSRGIGGFSRAGGEKGAKPLVNAASQLDAPPAQRENPLRLSGLVFAGANRRGDAKETEEDGIVTAEEIAALDLSDVGWAVLSACETGAGDVRLREGVFGLRRAFQVAGAGTLIMSLWPVDDEATRAWMVALYRARLVDGLETAAAVRRASRAVLDGRRERGESPHPFYWGSFVAAGDWR